MERLTEKQKLLAIVGGAVGLCLLAGAGVYWATGLIEEERLAIEAKQAEIAQAEEKIAKIDAAEKEVIILRENLGEYVKILPETKDLVSFVKVLNQFERESGIQPVEFKPGRPATAGSERFIRIEYTYDMTATLWQFMKFINRIENFERFVGITNVNLSAGGVNGTQNMDARDNAMVHSMKLTMETYTYNGKASASDVEIPDYDEKRTALSNEIFKRQQAIRMERWDHRGQLGRRDIFVDPRQLLTPGNTMKGLSPGEQLKIITQFSTEVENLRDMWKRARRSETTVFEQYSLEKALRDGLVKIQEGIADVDARGVLSFPPYRLKWTKDVVDGVDELQRQVADLGKDTDPNQRRDPYLPKPEMEQLAADMERLLAAGNLEEARSRFEAIQVKLVVPPEDPRHELAVQLQALNLKAATALEFKSMDIKIQGVLVNRDGQSGVVLNGEVYAEGEYVNDSLFVRAVQEEQVYFVFKGLTLVRTL